MIVIDPGHKYALSTLDGDGAPVVLTFVKRIGANYPGNESAYAGTTLQETLRACLDRIKYLDRQKPHSGNIVVFAGINNAIIALEDRASERHGRPYNGSHDCVYGIQCPKCLHVGCEAQCHPDAPPDDAKGGC